MRLTLDFLFGFLKSNVFLTAWKPKRLYKGLPNVPFDQKSKNTNGAVKSHVKTPNVTGKSKSVQA